MVLLLVLVLLLVVLEADFVIGHAPVPVPVPVIIKDPAAVLAAAVAAVYLPSRIVILVINSIITLAIYYL